MAALEPEFYLLYADDHGDSRRSTKRACSRQPGYTKPSSSARTLSRSSKPWVFRWGSWAKSMVPGQYEMSVKHGSPIEAIDRYWALKAAVRDLARTNGWIATFMPKIYSTWAGNSLHVHLSLWDQRRRDDLTPGTLDNESLSDIGRWFLGGIASARGSADRSWIADGQQLQAIACPVPGRRPTSTGATATAPGSRAFPASAIGGTSNTALATTPAIRRSILTGLLAAGLDGIRNQIDPGPPFRVMWAPCPLTRCSTPA